MVPQVLRDDVIRFRPLAALAALALSAAPSVAGEERPLTAAVPDDVFLVTYSRHNPERQFLEDYWAAAGQAFRESGVVEDLFDLVLAPAADEEALAEITALRERFGALCGAVDWDALGSGEVVFAERMKEPLEVKPGAVLAVPEVVFLFRMQGDGHEQVFEALSELFGACVDELGSLTGMPLAAVLTTAGEDVELVTFDPLQMLPEGPRFPITIGRYADLLLLTTGQAMQQDVLGLLTGEGTASMAGSERFRAALARLPEPEDGFEYVDLQAVRGGLEAYLGAVFEGVERELGDAVDERIENTRREGEAYLRGREGVAAYLAGDYEEALRLTREAYAMDPTDTVLMFNQACLHALLGRPDEALGWLEKAVEGGFWAPGQIEAEPDLESLREHPRYRAAVVRAGEEAGGPAAWARAVRGLFERGLGALGTYDHAVTVHRTEGCSVYSDSISTLAPGAREAPFHRVLVSGHDVEDFARHLPVECTSFSVSSGWDPELLYGFLEESVEQTGRVGQKVLRAWADLQEERGFDLRRDVLAWLGSTTVSASFPLDGKDAWVRMVEVEDGPTAEETLAAALETLPEMLAELAGKNPMLAMLTPRVQPTANPELAGFHDVAIGMMTTPAVCGVRGGWLICGSSAEAVLLSQATAAGEHPNVRANEALMAAALVPDGPARAVSFTDHEGAAETAAAVLSGISMSGGMVAASIPDPDARRVVTRLAAALSKLAPVVAKIDFYDASARVTTFDGEAWRTRSVTHFVPPADGD